MKHLFSHNCLFTANELARVNPTLSRFIVSIPELPDKWPLVPASIKLIIENKLAACAYKIFNPLSFPEAWIGLTNYYVCPLKISHFSMYVILVSQFSHSSGLWEPSSAT